jgi:hypothetical protein
MAEEACNGTELREACIERKLEILESCTTSYIRETEICSIHNELLRTFSSRDGCSVVFSGKSSPDGGSIFVQNRRCEKQRDKDDGIWDLGRQVQ